MTPLTAGEILFAAGAWDREVKAKGPVAWALRSESNFRGVPLTPEEVRERIPAALARRVEEENNSLCRLIWVEGGVIYWVDNQKVVPTPFSIEEFEKMRAQAQRNGVPLEGPAAAWAEQETKRVVDARENEFLVAVAKPAVEIPTFECDGEVVWQSTADSEESWREIHPAGMVRFTHWSEKHLEGMPLRMRHLASNPIVQNAIAVQCHKNGEQAFRLCFRNNEEFKNSELKTYHDAIVILKGNLT